MKTNGDSGAPPELVEAWICERFHKFPSELDEEDISRLYPMVAALNIQSALNRVMNSFLETHGKIKPSQNDWKIYANAVKAAKESNA